MMDTKLTLKLDKETIEKAKQYASSHQRSLSDIVETYLKVLTIENEPRADEEIEISPFVKSLSTGHTVPSDLDLKGEYRKHTKNKYQ